MTGPGLRLLAVTLLRLACLLAVVTLALAVGFAAGWGAHITLATSSHHRWMAPPVPGDLALYEPEGGAAHEAARWLLRDTRPSLTVPASGWAVTTTSGPDGGSQGLRSPVRPATGQALRGYATYYATGPDCLCAAAGPALRVGAWRGSTVTVCAANEPGHCVQARISDACWCIPRHDKPTLLDLSDEAFAALAPLSRGIVEVTVTWP